jgi:tetratricopeptide (TPR) repeat protein
VIRPYRHAPSLCMVLATLALVFGSSCKPRPQRGGLPNEATVALLGTVRALHHQADVYEHAGDYARAAAAVQRVLAQEFPAGFGEAEAVRVDAYGRLAELSLRQQRPDDALSLADTGLREARRESVLRARLLMVRGEVLSRLADRAREAQDTAGAARYRDEALRALEDSIALNQRVLRRALGDGGSP